MTPNLWPGDLGRQRVSTPLAVMRKQARQLTKLSDGWLSAEVRTSGSGSNALLQHSFVILAPCLGEIEFPLFSVRHGMMLYPLTISTNQYITNAGYECFDEEEFLEALREILGADATRRIITSLISQAEDSQEPEEEPEPGADMAADADTVEVETEAEAGSAVEEDSAELEPAE